MKNASLSVKDLSIKKENRNIVSGLSFTIPEKGLVLISGKSGTGKTTFLNAISLLDSDYSGDVFYCGKNVKRLKKSEREKIIASNGYFLADGALLGNITVEQNFRLLGFNDISGIKESLEYFKVLDLISQKADSLSVGELARVNMALIYYKKPDMVFADEPIANLDPDNAAVVSGYLISYSKSHIVFVASHQNDFFDGNEDLRISFLDGGKTEVSRINSPESKSLPLSSKEMDGFKKSQPDLNSSFAFLKSFFSIHNRFFFTSSIFFILAFFCLSFVFSLSFIDYDQTKANLITHLGIDYENCVMDDALLEDSPKMTFDENVSEGVNDVIPFQYGSFYEEKNNVSLNRENVDFVLQDDITLKAGSVSHRIDFSDDKWNEACQKGKEKELGKDYYLPLAVSSNFLSYYGKPAGVDFELGDVITGQFYFYTPIKSIGFVISEIIDGFNPSYPMAIAPLKTYECFLKSGLISDSSLSDVLSDKLSEADVAGGDFPSYSIASYTSFEADFYGDVPSLPNEAVVYSKASYEALKNMTIDVPNEASGYFIGDSISQVKVVGYYETEGDVHPVLISDSEIRLIYDYFQDNGIMLTALFSGMGNEESLYLNSSSYLCKHYEDLENGNIIDSNLTRTLESFFTSMKGLSDILLIFAIVFFLICVVLDGFGLVNLSKKCEKSFVVLKIYGFSSKRVLSLFIFLLSITHFYSFLSGLVLSVLGNELFIHLAPHFAKFYGTTIVTSVPLSILLSLVCGIIYLLAASVIMAIKINKKSLAGFLKTEK